MWLIALMSGCAGYQIGNESLYRPDVHTVYVPIFESDSFRRNLGERLTEAVVKQIEFNTPYKVVGSSGADSILTGRIVSEGKRTIAENTNDEPRDVEIGLLVQVSWVDRRGDLINQSVGYPVPPVLLNIGQGVNFAPEAGQSTATAHQEAVQRLARQIVAQMEIAW